MANRLLSLAFHLPQFHAIPENDRWWGNGFTEWTHLDRWRPLFPGHVIRQPVAPLGRYNLLDASALEAQAALARAHGIDGFLLWDYWFGAGRQLLERPAALIREQALNVSYAFAWANHDWVDKRRRRLLMKQHYLGESDYEAYFMQCLPHFLTPAYVKVDGRPFFFVYRPEHVPDLAVFIRTWRRLARQHGLAGLHLVGDVLDPDGPPPPGFDQLSCTTGMWANRSMRQPANVLKTVLRRFGAQTSPLRYDFAHLMRGWPAVEAEHGLLHTVFTGWDTTPRHGSNGVIVDGLNADSFGQHLADIRQQLPAAAVDPAIVLVKSWNEWAEGNLLEPDTVHGDRLLTCYRDFVNAVRTH